MITDSQAEQWSHRFRSSKPADGFEDSRGRVEFRAGPKVALTQRSINHLGVIRIVFR